MYFLGVRSNAFTGGIDGDGGVLNIGEEVIQQKIKAIFFSEVNTFVVPKLEETYAYFALTQLKKKYPARNLKLIPVENIYDVLNRRDLVEIKKINPVVRTGKFVKKNWMAGVIATLLTIILSFLFVLDFDDNPAIVSSNGQLIYIKNKNGKILYSLDSNLDPTSVVHNNFLKDYVQIVDINNDGVNEILFVPTSYKDDFEKESHGTILCFDKNKRIIWQYVFQDSVFSEREVLDPTYNVTLIDTTEMDTQKIIFCYANNNNSFSSAIFALNIKTGIRINKTQWNSGYTWDGLLIDINNDNKKDFVGIGADNGYEDGVVWGVQIDKMNGYRPTTQNYRIQNFPVIDPIFYIRIPKTDYDKYVGLRVVGMIPGTLEYNNSNSKLTFGSQSIADRETIYFINSLIYILNPNLEDFEIYVSDQLRMARDSLVVKGKLNLPFTDTMEYINLQKNKLLYWKNGSWAKRISSN